MSHHVSGMSRVWDMSEGFSQIISRIDDPWDVLHGDVSVIFPPLDCKESHVCVPGSSSCLVLPACHRSHVASVFSFFLAKNPRAYSLAVVDFDCVALIDLSIDSVDMSASLHLICSLLCSGHN